MTGDPYQVAISFCDGQVLMHDHPNAADASQDYADALGEAFEPTETEEDRRHIRQVTLMKYDEKGVLSRHIDSGVMNEDCRHATTKGTK